MKDFIMEEWKNISLMTLLFVITVYFMYKGETQVLMGTILPMLAVGLNLTTKK